METCTAEFARLTAPLAGLQCDAHPFLTLRNPFTLQHWTFPVIELLMIAGAVAGLIHAVRWYRQHSDASNLVAWIALMVAPLVIEPFTYFPQWFGIEDSVGLVFAHGQFSVQFLYDRLPLYIVAMYPFFGYGAYVLVQRSGIFKKYNALIGGTCVAFTFLAMYEVIDMVGPQWRWWVWNTELAMSKPSFGTVPYACLQSFALAVPLACVVATRLLARKPIRGAWPIARSVIIACVAVWPTLMVPPIIGSLGGFFTSEITARFVVTWAMILGAGATTAYALVGAYRARVSDPQFMPDGARSDDHFAAVYVAVYLALGMVFWGAALPDFLAAEDGLTPSGNPTSSSLMALAGGLCAIAITVGAYALPRGAQAVSTGEPVPGGELSANKG